jgi:hypothetical protein
VIAAICRRTKEKEEEEMLDRQCGEKNRTEKAAQRNAAARQQLRPQKVNPGSRKIIG